MSAGTRRIALILALSFLPAARANEVSLQEHIRPLLKKHCVRCHGPEKQQGGLRLDTLTEDFADRDNALAWLEVRDNVNLGEMPPPDEGHLSADDVLMLSSWISAGQRAAERSVVSTGGRVLLRRLNREEYTNMVTDLLHVKFAPGESPLEFLPPDGEAEGFNKVSHALMLDPSLMQMYYRVARQIAERAVVDGPPEYPTEIMRLEFEEIVHSNAISYLTRRLGLRPVDGGLMMIDGSTRSFGMLRYPGRRDNNVAPVSGFYRFTVRAGAALGENGTIPRLAITHSHPAEDMKLIGEFDVDAPLSRPKEYTFVVPRDDQGGEVQVRIVPGTSLTMSQRPGEHFMSRNREAGEAKDFAEVIRLRGRQIAEGASGERATPDPEKLETTRFPRVFLDWLEVEGPLYDQWPPRSHEEIFFRGSAAEDDADYAREIFARILPRAWRRPVLPEEVEPFVDIVRKEQSHGQGLRDAVRTGLTAVLCSPRFLYVFEPAKGNGSRMLTSYEVATRLSLLLWNSMPDDELFQMAAANRLLDIATLESQVDRMMADPKIERFIDSFAGQWLRTDTFLAFAPDRNIYRDFDSQLGKWAVREPLEFTRHVLREDLSLLSFIDSDFVVVNEPLADHYGLHGVTGDNFRPVTLPQESPRGGLLGMLGVHLAGSDGIRTKPVARAVYVREVLFNDPPDPPPPNAGEIEPNIRGENLTVRERLLQHQQIESCAGCHRQLDPWGLALENFNVVGRWRDKQDGERFRNSGPPIVVAGQLPNGEPFSTFQEYRELLLRQADRFRRGLAEKLWVYSLGRPIEPSDDAMLTALTQRMQKNGDTFRELLKAVVTSPAFLTK